MKINNAPLVSVIMPVYNAGRFLVPAVESILKQTYKNIEFIIVDDGSSDGSWGIIKTYQKQYPNKIIAVQTEKTTNAAGNGATNFGLTFAKGKYIARMDADDISHPKRIEKQVGYMEDHQEILLLGTQATVINAKGEKTGIKTVPVAHNDIYTTYGIIHPIIHPSVMIRRSMLPNPMKLYAMRYDVNDDYYTFFRLLQVGTFANLPECLISYRIHGNNASLVYIKEKFINSVKIRVDAVLHLNYRISFQAIFLMVIQSLIIGILPERIIVPVYMFIRDIPSAIKNLEKKFIHTRLSLKDTLHTKQVSMVR
ncbi:TPA: hypothetical protein DIS60_02055 [Patescibacteria group bacterium]|nr:hypothetical protein [Patescibacteria group bacterium]